MCIFLGGCEIAIFHQSIRRNRIDSQSQKDYQRLIHRADGPTASCHVLASYKGNSTGRWGHYWSFGSSISKVFVSANLS